jgi:predicted metal-dependent enzyme (double-stranded beta helix superfamily)|tara:strand:+ start:2341 stop:2763 length:423 start_codon:yes stop_codon:yes gene_type:complete
MYRFTTTIILFIATAGHSQQNYPNIDGETLLEDDRVVVQRFVLEPGQWEGIHEHPENQLVIVLNSTQELIYRFRGSERIFERPEDDTVRAFWRPGPVFMSDEHESGNTGTRPLEWIAITFKKESISTDDPPEQFVESGEE